MISSTPRGYFVRVPGSAAPQGPYRTLAVAERVLANATSRGQNEVRTTRTNKAEPLAVRVIKHVVGQPRTERRARAVTARREHRAIRRHDAARAKRAERAAVVVADGHAGEGGE